MIEIILISTLSGAVAGVIASWIMSGRNKKTESEETEPEMPVKPYVRPRNENEEYVKHMAEKLHGK